MINFLALLALAMLVFLFFTHGKDFFNPLVFSSLSLAFYGVFSVWMVRDYVGIRDFPPDLIKDASVFSFFSLLFFVGGCALSSSNVFKPVDTSSLGMVYEFSSLFVIVCVLLSLLGSYALMVFSAGSVSDFMDNLNMRQIWSVGNNWLMFFVAAGKFAIFALMETYFSKKDNRYLVLMAGIVLFELFVQSIVGGRQHSLLLIIEIYLISRYFYEIPLKIKMSGIFLSLFIFLFYGFYRYFQGENTGGFSGDLVDFILDDEDSGFFPILRDNMFDGWYVLLSAMLFTVESESFGYGGLMLASLFKFIPGGYNFALSITFPDYLWIGDHYGMQFRAMSYLSEFWLDYGWFALVVFGVFGFFLGYIYKCILHAGSKRSFGLILFFVLLYVNFFIGIRNGLGFVIAFLSIDLIWLVVYFLFRNRAIR